MTVSVAGSCCSDLREINEAKFYNILSYLDGVSVGASKDLGDAETSTTSQKQQQQQQQPSLSVINTNQQSFVGATTNGAACCSVYSMKTAASTMPLMPLSGENGQVYHGIKKRIDELKWANETLTQENEMLRKKVANAKSAEETVLNKAQVMALKEIEALRNEHKELQQTHNKTVNKLLRDKEALTKRCEELSQSLTVTNGRLTHETKRLEDAHVAAITTLKGKWKAHESKEREEWMMKKAKEIKEATLKAMEPDIKMLMDRHRADIARVHEERDYALRRKDEEIGNLETQLVEVRSAAGREVENTLIRERDEYRRRMCEEAQRAQSLIEEERRKANEKREMIEAFYNEQKDTYMRTITGLEKQVLELRGVVAAETARYHEGVALDVSRQMAAKEVVLNQRRMQLENEVEKEKVRLTEENARVLRGKEEELRIAMRVERDAAVTQAVSRMEKEHITMLEANKETVQVSKERGTRLEREVTRLNAEKQLLEQQLQTANAAHKELSGVMERLQQQIKQIQDRESNITDTLEAGFEERLRQLDNLWQTRLRTFETQHVDEVEGLMYKSGQQEKQLQRKCETMEIELRAMEQRHNAELSSINDKVVVSITKKDATIQLLQEQLNMAQLSIQERETELLRHRQLIEQ